MAVQQVIADAVLTNAPLHIVHIKQFLTWTNFLAIEMVKLAKQKGYDITTELYPILQHPPACQTSIFDDGWQKELGIGYGDLQWVETGKRLTKETFDQYEKPGEL
jgi:dihydroorotase